MSFLECPFHKYVVIPFFDIFTLGMYGGVCNRYRLEKELKKNLAILKNGLERPDRESDSR
jgi:hypothetical protein